MKTSAGENAVDGILTTHRPTLLGGTANAEDSRSGKQTSIRNKNQLHWNLRSFHLNEESFRGRDQDERTSWRHHAGDPNNNANHLQQSRHATAVEIFELDRSSDNSNDRFRPRTVFADGREVCFELQENVTQKPTVDREARVQASRLHINAEKSPWDVRARLWMIRQSLLRVTFAYIALFLLVNVTFAALFYAYPDRCCDNPDLTFAQVFDFTVQTSATIGYGGYVPKGWYANFLVLMLTYISVLLNTVLAGLLFLKFVTPVAKIQFSDVLVYCNCNGLPCLQLRVGNADGEANLLTDMTARLTHLYEIHYQDEHGNEQRFAQRQPLELLSDRNEEFVSIWTLKHIIDENSPLFALNLSEFPGNKIIQLAITINAVHDVTKAPISAHAKYLLEDIMIGHAFEDQISWSSETRELVVDYAKLSNTKPAPVWYPQPRRG